VIILVASDLWVWATSEGKTAKSKWSRGPRREWACEGEAELEGEGEGEAALEGEWEEENREGMREGERGKRRKGE
jgi:hypothetical protein